MKNQQKSIFIEKFYITDSGNLMFFYDNCYHTSASSGRYIGHASVYDVQQAHSGKFKEITIPTSFTLIFPDDEVSTDAHNEVTRVFYPAPEFVSDMQVALFEFEEFEFWCDTEGGETTEPQFFINFSKRFTEVMNDKCKRTLLYSAARKFVEEYTYKGISFAVVNDDRVFVISSNIDNVDSLRVESARFKVRKEFLKWCCALSDEVISSLYESAKGTKQFYTVGILRDIGIDYFSFPDSGLTPLQETEYRDLYNQWRSLGSGGADLRIELTQSGGRIYVVLLDVTHQDWTIIMNYPFSKAGIDRAIRDMRNYN